MPDELRKRFGNEIFDEFSKALNALGQNMLRKENKDQHQFYPQIHPLLRLLVAGS